jgi:predicted amidohydrolase
MNTLTVATVQMESHNGDYEGNQAWAESLIMEAIRRKARLIVIPEFALAGYIFSDAIWDGAEYLKGPAYQWLKAICRKHDVFIATCVLERSGSDFFDTLILVGPGEGDFWSHRKIEPASYEAFFFRGAGVNPCVFDTPLGRIGVAICFDSSKTHTLRALIDGGAQIVLALYSCPALPGFVPRIVRDNWDSSYRMTADIYQRVLLAPVVSCNKTGVVETTLPLIPLYRARMEFLSGSSILNYDGTLIGTLETGSGVLTGEVRLGDCRCMEASRQLIPTGRWMPQYGVAVRAIADFTHLFGRLRYSLSWMRRRAARVTAAR